MNERLKRTFDDFETALKNLSNAVNIAKSELEIDGVIKRFELCYELSWKLIKEYLSNLGIICKNPRLCFKYAFQNDIIENEDIWLTMIDDRNELVHMYDKANSRKIFDNIKNTYLNAFTHIFTIIKKEFDNE